MIILASLHLISICFLACKHIGNSAASLSISIRINGFAHCFIGSCIIEECADFIDNLVIIRTYKMNGSAGKCLWTFSSVSHYEYGLAKTWGFFLNAT